MDIMSGSEEKTPTVSPDQGATGETTPSSESKEAHYKEGKSADQPECSKLCSQYVIGSQVAEELPWFLFVEDPMGEYMHDMETIGHAYSKAPPLPQNRFAFKDKLDFVYDMQLKDFKDSNHKLDDGVSYEALQMIEKQHGKIFEECKKMADLAKEDGDPVKYEIAYKRLKEIELIKKQTHVKIQLHELQMKQRN